MRWLVKLDRWMKRHPKLLEASAVIFYVVLGFSYTPLIDLPVWLQVPVWAGAIFHAVRWTIWEQHVRPRIAGKMEQAALSEPDAR